MNFMRSKKTVKSKKNNWSSFLSKNMIYVLSILAIIIIAIIIAKVAIDQRNLRVSTGQATATTLPTCIQYSVLETNMNDIYHKGALKWYSFAADRCLDNVTVVEADCGRTSTDKYTCPANYICTTGVCVPKTQDSSDTTKTSGAAYQAISTVLGDRYINCSYVGSSDGWNVRVKGSITAKRIDVVGASTETFTDLCMSDGAVTEYNCDSSSFAVMRKVTCPANELCLGGICAVKTECNDGTDNDKDGLIDAADTGCIQPPTGGAKSAPAISEFTNDICNDGIDNDNDKKIDYKVDGTGDSGCTSPTGTDECNYADQQKTCTDRGYECGYIYVGGGYCEYGCGTCTLPKTCDMDTLKCTTPVCTPNCVGKTCGQSNGCSGTCPSTSYTGGCTRSDGSAGECFKYSDNYYLCLEQCLYADHGCKHCTINICQGSGESGGQIYCTPC